jgi:hypothetical protein
VAGVSRLLAALAVAAVAAPLPDSAVRDEVDRLVGALAAARHLPFHGTLPARAVSRGAGEREISLAIGAGLASAVNDAEGDMLARLGLGPGGAGYGTLLARTFSPSPAARYDLATGSLWVPDFIRLEDQRLALAHEIAHAIADQRFGLRRFLGLDGEGGRRLDGDAARARLALVEGDATLTALELTDPRETFLGARALAALAVRLRTATDQPGAPPWLGALAGFTHIDGLLFAARARARGPWSAVDALWAYPPASTEEILHPEKYDACEAPIAVPGSMLPELPGFGPPAATDVLGELVARTWLASALPPEIAERAAAGWGGDRAGSYARRPDAAPSGGGIADGGADAADADDDRQRGADRDDAARPLAWLTIWDDAGEAEDFARAAAQVLAAQAAGPHPTGAKTGTATGTTTDPTTGAKIGTTTGSGTLVQGGGTRAGERVVFPSATGAVYALDRRDAAVALLFAAPERALPALDQMLAAWRRQSAASRTASRRSATHPRRAARPDCPRRDRGAGSR